MSPARAPFWFFAIVVAMFVVLGTTSDLVAQKKGVPPARNIPPAVPQAAVPHIPLQMQMKKPANPANAPIPGSPLHTIIANLENTREVLNGANHDYKGHRANALHHVSQAMRELEHHPHHKHEAPVPRLPYVKPVHENQAVSDAALVQARVQLVNIHQALTALHNSHPKFHGHKNIHQAGHNMSLAVHQIGIALADSPVNTPPLSK